MLDRKKILMGSAAVVGLLLADVAIAQSQTQSLFSRDRNISVLQKARPDYDALGLRAGSFIIKPKVDVSAAYTDNVFALSPEVSAEFGEQSDTYFVFRPSVGIESDWNRHSLSGGLYSETWQHVDFDGENVSNAGLFADGRIDVNYNTAITLGGSYDWLHETRFMNNSVLVPVEPVEYDRSRAYIGLQQEFGRIRYRGRLDFADYDYDDVQVVDPANSGVFLTTDQDFRDRQDTSVLLEAGFATTRDSSVFLRGVFRQRDFDNLSNTVLAGSPLDRDSDGYTISAGVDFDVTNLIRGNIAIGYMEEDFKDDRLRKIDGLALDAGLEWFPSERTTVGLTASRDVRPSSVFTTDANGNPLVNDAGFIANEVVLSVDHELARNIILSGSVGYGLDDYKEFNREDERYAATLAATYLINRHFAARLEYAYTDQSTDATDALSGLLKDYTANELMLTVTAQY